MNIIMICHIFCYRTLNTGRHEEILLFQAKFFSRNMIVIWIKHLTDRTCKVLLLYCFLIISFIKGIQIKGIDCFNEPYGTDRNQILYSNSCIVKFFGYVDHQTQVVLNERAQARNLGGTAKAAFRPKAGREAAFLTIRRSERFR